jgi:hypothetical protein
VQPPVVPAFILDPLSDDTARIDSAMDQALANAEYAEHFDAAGFEARRKPFSTVNGEATAAGLPQRAPGEALIVHDMPAAPDRQVLDPELARARLSSLASGLAAAQKHVPPPR